VRTSAFGLAAILGVCGLAAAGARADAGEKAGAAAAGPVSAAPTWQDLVQKRDWLAAERELRRVLTEAARKDFLKDLRELGELYYYYCVARYFPLLRERILEAQAREQLTNWLLEHRGFTEQLLWALSERDDAGKAFAVVADLVNAFGERVAQFPALAVAYATVWDTANYNPSLVVQGFHFYTTQGRRMIFDPQTLPVALCKYLVDGRATVEEKQEALQRYATQKYVANLLDTVRLDEDAYRDARRARLRDKPYTLANIRQYGGTQRDRVYFATEVGKAIGVPCTALTVEKGSYATTWVAYLYRSGTGTVTWRYGAGRNFHLDDDADGAARDPKEGCTAFADDLERDATLLEIAAEHQRRFAVCLGVAALLLGEEGGPRLPREKPPEAGKEDMPLLDAALRLAATAHEIHPLAPEPWQLVAQVSQRLGRGGTPLIERALENLYTDQALAQRPHTAFHIFQTLFKSLPEAPPELRQRHLQRAAALCKGRGPLVAHLAQLEGKLLASSGRKGEALTLLAQAAIRHAQDGHVVVDLLEDVEALARDANDLDLAIRAHESVLARLPRPNRGAWARETIYYHLLDRLARAYRDRGDMFKVDFYSRQMKALVSG